MKTAIMCASAAASITLASLGFSPAQAHAEDDPCAGITDAAAHQACVDGFPRDNPMRRTQLGNCEASPIYGQVGQLCRDSWVRKSLSPKAG